MKRKKTYKVIESESAECRNVRIIKLSECAMSTFGIKPIMIAEDEKIEPAPAKKYKDGIYRRFYNLRIRS